MPFSSLPVVAAATASVKETATSVYAGWRAFFFLRKVAMDDWSWTELAEMFTLYLEESPDSRAEIKRMAMAVIGGVLLFLAAPAAITYCVWRRKSSVIRARLIVQTGCIAALNGSNAVLNGRIAVLTGSLGEAEQLINILLEQWWQGPEDALAVEQKRRQNDQATNSATGSHRVDRKDSLGTDDIGPVSKNIPSPDAASRGYSHRNGGNKRCKGTVCRTRIFSHVFKDHSSNSSRGIAKHEVFRQGLRATASRGQMAPARATGKQAQASAIHAIAAASSSCFAAKDVALASPRLRADARVEQKGRCEPQAIRGNQGCRNKEHYRDDTAPVPTDTPAIERMESGVRTRNLPRVFDKLSRHPHRHNTRHEPPFKSLRDTNCH